MEPSLIEVARELRQRAELTTPAFSTNAILGAAFPEVLVTGYDFPTAVNEATSRAHGGPVILYRRGLSAPEQRVAIAHGLAHLIFDADEECRRPLGTGSWREKRADAFAAELLVPLDEIAQLLRFLPSRERAEQQLYLDHVDCLASTFKVPAVLIRQRIRLLVTSAH